MKRYQTPIEHSYWWILAIEPTKIKPVILGPYRDYNEAWTTASSRIQANYEIVELRTRNLEMAKKLLRERQGLLSNQLDAMLRDREKRRRYEQETQS